MTLAGIVTGVCVGMLTGFIVGHCWQKNRLNVYRKMAYTDELGIANQREFYRLLKIFLKRGYWGNNEKFVLCLLDLDQFKELNTRWGYTQADQVLIQFVQLLLSNVRNTDRVFRYRKGDEFAILFRDCNLSVAQDIGERIRQMVAHYPFLVYNHPVKLTISMGMVTPTVKDSIETVTLRAEEALALAKHSRNQLIATNSI